MTSYDEERIGDVLRLLTAPPASWVLAAQELPLARATIGEIVARAEADAAFRSALVADFAAALAAEGYEATPSVVAALRLRLAAD